MSQFALPALVRSGVPDLLRDDGWSVETEPVSGRARRSALRNQFSQQFESYCTRPDIESLAEMVDLLEAIAKDRGVDSKDLVAKRRELREKQGTYTDAALITQMNPPEE